MGFLSGLGKILSGKPVFEPQPTAQPTDPTEYPEQHQPEAPTSVPVVRIGRTESNLSGQRLRVDAVIKNESQQPVLLDRILVFGATRELDRTLQPGESHQFDVYDGAALRQQGGYADVQYRTPDNRYYSARHQIRYRQERDGSLLPTEFLLDMPINTMTH